MHDFILAKEIVDEVLAIALAQKLGKIKSVSLEIGSKSVPHNHKHAHEHDNHFDELNIENIKFGLENIAKNTILEKTKFKIIKTSGVNWKITDVDV